MTQSDLRARGKSGSASYVTFSLANETYAIDVLQVQEVLKLTEIAPVPGVPDYILGIINLRGDVVTVIDARRRMGLPDRFAFTLDLTMRFVPTLMRDFRITRDAQRARGYELEASGQKGLAGLLRVGQRIAPLMVPVVVRAVLDAEDRPAFANCIDNSARDWNTAQHARVFRYADGNWVKIHESRAGGTLRLTVTHVDTSTGVAAPLAEVGAIMREFPETVLIADGVCATAAEPGDTTAATRARRPRDEETGCLRH